MLKKQILIDNILKNPQTFYLSNLKKNQLIISGMSNLAASNILISDFFFSPLSSLLSDFNQFPQIGHIESKLAAFNWVLDRQCKFKINLNLSCLPPFMYMTYNLLILKSEKLNKINKTTTYGIPGANLQFFMISPFIASCYLLPL